VGRTYAGILGPLAMVTVVLRSVLHGGGVETALAAGLACLFAFAALGYAAGELAGWIVNESVRARFDAELAARQAEGKAN
jgi:hypothetical protein